MTSRRTRLLLAPVLALLLGLLLGACGGDDEGGSGSSTQPSTGALKNLTVSGDFGAKPKLTWDGEVTAKKTEAATLIEGSGDTVSEGDLVLTHILVANGRTEKVLTSDYDASPQLFPITDQLLTALRENIAGATVGSRVVIASTPEDAFGAAGSETLGLKADDTAVFVLDVSKIVSEEPSGTEVKPQAWMPEVTESDGVPTALDFSGTPKPKDSLRVGTLVEGDGKKLRDGDQVYVNYLGQVYGGKQPFDASYTRGQPFSFVLGQGQVVQGWDEALAGVPVGSRVLISVPPKLGYGKQGQGDIKGDDTMYFVIDVLAAG